MPPLPLARYRIRITEVRENPPGVRFHYEGLPWNAYQRLNVDRRVRVKSDELVVAPSLVPIPRSLHVAVTNDTLIRLT